MEWSLSHQKKQEPGSEPNNQEAKFDVRNVGSWGNLVSSSGGMVMFTEGDGGGNRGYRSRRKSMEK